TACDALLEAIGTGGNVRICGERPTMGGVPEPSRATVTFPPFVSTSSVPLLSLVTTGEKLTEYVQLAPEASHRLDYVISNVCCKAIELQIELANVGQCKCLGRAGCIQYLAGKNQG